MQILHVYLFFGCTNLRVSSQSSCTDLSVNPALKLVRICVIVPSPYSGVLCNTMYPLAIQGGDEHFVFFWSCCRAACYPGSFVGGPW